MTKRYSSKIELKSIAMEFAVKNSSGTIESLFIEIDRLKSTEKLSDGEILVTSIKKYCKI